MGTPDRTVRFIIAAVIALLYFTDTTSGTTGLILMILAAVFLLTSQLGYCPLYSLFGITTNREK